MRRNLLPRLICPACLRAHADEAALRLVAPDRGTETDVVTGRLACPLCGKEYLVENGIAELLTDEAASARAATTAAWEDLARREAWLDPPPEYLDALPFPAALQYAPKDTITWDRHCRNFFEVLSKLDLSGKDVLDLAAGRCWSTKYLALRGARAVATDLMSHATLGLGAAESLMARSGVFFERVCCDMNSLPFATASFDGVFVSGSLHHTDDLDRAMGEIGRVCRDGGFLAMTNEPGSGPRARREHGDDKDRTGEHNYRTWRQLRALRRGGFRGARFYPDAYFGKKDDYCHSPFFHFLGRLTRRAYGMKVLLRGGIILLTARRKRRAGLDRAPRGVAPQSAKDS